MTKSTNPNSLISAIKAALEQKHGANHPDTKNVPEDKAKKNLPPVSSKPMKKVTGRGR